ncbi:hypothetical protein PQD13_gp01 [Gordonia phage Clawz]|uniref:Uncharacterized protein n=1 Tax=Gordonia phage Clawz TaxID=2743910 RepID=A0AAE7K656_9CAUD|nr:hypothetical protein PQD13_gp01 [Gordonia phage Clawz]QKY79913.1 hypothetical protein SEA_CLAWZ_1 [Gordonia phage Clawz]
MSHNIHQADGIASFASAREHAWHRLGVTLPDAMTAEEALNAAHLAGWNVRKVPEYAHLEPTITDDGVTPGVQLETGRFSTIRTNPVNGADELLGSGLGSGYTVIQNEEHADLLNTLIDESGAHFETAGALGNGSTVFLSMKMPRDLQIVGHEGIDTTNLYVVAQNSHDGTSAFRLMVTPVRVVCANTLRAAFGNKLSSFSIRHTTNAKQNIQLAREALGLTWAYADEFEKAAARMIEVEINKQQAVDTVRSVMKYTDKGVTDRIKRSQEERTSEIITLWTSADTQKNLRGTAYGLYNAFAEWVDHFAPVYGEADNESVRASRVAKGGEASRIKEAAWRELTKV